MLKTIIFLITLTNSLFWFDSLLLAQTNNFIQEGGSKFPNPIPRIIPRDTTPNSFPEKTPQPPPELLPSESPNSPSQLNNTLCNRKIHVSKFDFKDYEIFSLEELKQIKVFSSPETTTIGAINNQELSCNQLVEIATKVTDYYKNKGYSTSGAIAIIPEEVKTNPEAKVIITIQVLEGLLEDIKIRETNTEEEGRLGNYIRDRLGVNQDETLNVEALLRALRLLQIDPLLKRINAQLAPGSDRGTSILFVDYIAANSFNPKISLDNSRPPSIGTFQREIELREDNLLGLGDSISIGYRNTDGSHRIDSNYTVPITPDNATIGFLYTWADNDVIQDPFFDIDRDGSGPDIESNYNAFDFIFKQPILRDINGQTYEELNLRLTTSWRETKSFLLDTGFPLSPGADESGSTRVFALRFAQEYSRQNPGNIIAFRSEFNFGLDAFNSIINEPISGVEELPDSRFFAWRGQAQYVKLFAPDTLFLARSNIQLLSEGLFPIEQF